MKRYLPLIIILLGMAAVYFTGAYRYLSFAALKTDHAALKNYIALHRVAVPLLYILAYILVAALSIPGAVFLTLLGGYLFPQPWSTLYVVFGATCGATIIFLAARTALGDSLRKKAGPFLQKMESGFRENGARYMLFLRFVPLFPFWIVNIAPAFFGLPLKTYIWTTLIGITPGTIVFTLAGAGLEQVFESGQNFSLATIFNLKIKIALGLLGLLSVLSIFLKRSKNA